MSNPNAIGDAVLRIQELLRLEQWELAEASCRELVQVAPDNSGAWLHLAFAIEHCGGLSEAEWALREAIRLDARSADGWTNLSAVLHTLGKEEEAEHSARKAVAFDGSKAEYWFNLSLALDELDRWEEASDAYRECLARDPGSASAWNNLGLIEQKRGRLDAARSAYERCLAIAPNHADAQFNLANLSRKQDGTKEAAESLEVAASVANARMYVARGNVHLAREEFLEAERHYRQALRIAPANFAARFNLANALLKRRSVGEAEAIAQQLVAERPDDPEVWGVYSAALQVPGCWEKGLAARRQALARSPSANRHSSLLMGLQYADDPTAASLLAAHVQWNLEYGRHLSDLALPSRPRTKTLPRLGFVSPDFGRHPIGWLALKAIEELAKLGCPVVCYSDRKYEDDYTQRFRTLSERWRNVCDQSDDQVAEQIRRDEIDVLFDLAGHTGHRLPVFARKAAAIQVTWLGYVGTTGLTTMDYLLADRFHVPEGEDQNYAEKILRMPNGYACFEPPDDAPEVGALPVLCGHPFTFGCFNNPAKYSPGIFDAWASILTRVPGSRLLLKYGGLPRNRLLRQSTYRNRLSITFGKLRNVATREEFWTSYENLLDEELIESIPAAEYTRLEKEWLSMGAPDIVELFLLVRLPERYLKKPTESD